ncbi:MAG: molybdate transporter family protein [Syntrophomonadaceae bacterium]|nr:molybdate transporter family protein [Syntrophomonadaceae bacterium]
MNPVTDAKTNYSKPKIVNELSGAMGDLGLFLPHVLAAITVAGLNPASIFAGFGLFYIFCGWFYGIPMAVQPMKVASAVILTQKLTPGEVAAAGIVIGIIMLTLGLTGLIKKLCEITPAGITAGIQIGLGISLAMLGMKMVSSDFILGIITLVAMLLLLSSHRLPSALLVLFGGTALGLLLHPVALPNISIGLNWPEFILPSLADFKKGFLLIALPQIPLTLTNAVLVTASLSAQLYGERAVRVTEKNLSLTMGFANLISGFSGGYMMCHGSGGVAAHYRFGGRTWRTPFSIGLILLLFGILLGNDAVPILQLIPECVLGTLLFYSGLDLAMAAKVSSDRQEIMVILTVIILSLAFNPAVAFLAGLIINGGIKRNIIRI